MTPLEIIKEAYDKCGIFYVVRERDGYFYLFKCAEHTVEEYEKEELSVLMYKGFIEFYKDGSIASY